MRNMTCDLLHIQNQIAKGNEKAFAELYTIYNRKLCFFAKAITRSSEMAEEVVEDIFVNLWTNRDKISAINNLAVYLYVAAKNRSLNAISKKTEAIIQSPFDELDVEIAHTTTDPYSLMITAEMMTKMKQVIESLPPRCKLIFKLVREDGLKYGEVSEVLNISINTIDVQMAIAVKKICLAIQDAAVTDFVLKKRDH